MVLLLLFICRLLMAISVVNIVFFVLLLFAGEKFAGSVDRRMLAKDISEIVKKMWRVGGTALRVYITSRIQVLMKSLWRRWRIFRFGPLPRANSTLYTQSGKVRWSNQNQQKSVECFWHEWVDIHGLRMGAKICAQNQDPFRFCQCPWLVEPFLVEPVAQIHHHINL